MTSLKIELYRAFRNLATFLRKNHFKVLEKCVSAFVVQGIGDLTVVDKYNLQRLSLLQW